MKPQYFVILILFSLNSIILSGQIDDSKRIEENSFGLLSNPLLLKDGDFNLDASDGTFEYYVRLLWNGIPPTDGKPHYRLYRNTSENKEGRVEVNLTNKKRITNKFAFDYNVLPGVLYHYWVEMENDKGEKNMTSIPNSGFIPKSAAMASVVPYGESDFLGTGKNNVFTWSLVSQATTYQLQVATNTNWSTQKGFENSSIVLDTILSSNAFVWDTNNKADTMLWSVRAFNDAGESSYFSEIEKVYATKEVLTSSPSNYDIKLSADQSSIKLVKGSNQEINISYDIKNESDKKTTLLVYLSNDNLFGIDDVLLRSFPISNKQFLIIQSQLFEEVASKNDFLIVRTKDNTNDFITIKIE